MNDLNFLGSTNAATQQALYLAECGASAQFLPEQLRANSMSTMMDLTIPPRLDNQRMEEILKASEIDLKSALSTVTYNPETTVDCNSIEQTTLNVAQRDTPDLPSRS